MTTTERYTNRLINEKSPYLLQHAHNPVDWYSWCDEAFEKARELDKPIFLSIGYSTCHWCHVMEKESFENEKIAALMNEVFISIKVDREERPDIDNIYMLVCQALTGSGGWPLTIVMTPNKMPFFAATYIPPEARYGRIGMTELITNIESAWKLKRNEIESSANQILDYLHNNHKTESNVEINENIISQAFDIYKQSFDKTYGGFGAAPKFPSPHNLMFLLRYWKLTGVEPALEIVTKTLTNMRRGGIYDHIGFGFHRYSTDKEWLVPHFEKMLYDQALLIIIYTEAFQVTSNYEFKKTAEEIIEYVLRDMTSPLGGFYSAEDADSEGEEGKFYLWTKDELFDYLGPKDGNLAALIFNIKANGNSELELSKAHGLNIPYTNKDNIELSKTLETTTKNLESAINEIRLKLFQLREKRIHPFKDDKILTDWNGLMIAALAIAGRTFQNSEFLRAAEEAATFINNNLMTDERKLLHRFRDGSSAINSHLDDYAFLIWGQLELYQSTFKKLHLEEAIRLTDTVLNHFWDNDNNEFFFSPDYAEEILLRNKVFYDGAIPSGNSVMFNNMINLYHLTANPLYEKYFNKQITAISEHLSKAPTTAAFSLIGLVSIFNNSTELIICAKHYTKDLADIISKLRSYFLPNIIILFNGLDDQDYKPEFEYLNNYNLIDDKPTFYFCKNFTCELPSTDYREIFSKLGLSPA